jgi:hypothetical protein
VVGGGYRAVGLGTCVLRVSSVCDAAALAACVGCLVVTTAHGMQLLSNLSKSSKQAMHMWDRGRCPYKTR